MALNLQHQTLAEFGTRLRERFRNSTKEEAAYLAHRIIKFVQAGDITDAQVRNAFGLTVPQYDALKIRLIALRDHWQAIQDAQGE